MTRPPPARPWGLVALPYDGARSALIRHFRTRADAETAAQQIDPDRYAEPFIIDLASIEHRAASDPRRYQAAARGRRNARISLSRPPDES